MNTFYTLHKVVIHLTVIADKWQSVCWIKAVLLGHRTKPKSIKLGSLVSPNWNIWEIIRLPDSVSIVLRAYQRCYTQTICWIILRIDLKTA